MQHIIDIGGSILAWAVVLLRMNEAFHNRRVFKAWRFALAFALFGTFHIDMVHRAFDALVGINNLAWLSSCVFGALSIHPLSPKTGQEVTPKRKRIVNKVTALLRDNQGVGDPAGCAATRHMSGRGQG